MGELRINGTRGTVVVHTWENEDARYVALLSHGYGEHARRYEHLAAALVDDGAVVYAPDHHGHGLSDGERALVDDLDHGVDDLHLVFEQAAADNPGLPIVLIGHSMGGLIAARYGQRFGEGLAALVLSGPAVGGNPALQMLAEMDPIPEVPIDPAVLSRDPAVGQAYADDPLVYHGPFRRETLLGLGAAVEAVAAGPSFGALPAFWIHGADDQLVPLEHTRPAIEAVKGSSFEEKIYPGARHEVFNETNRDEVVADVLAFVGRHV
ncbi:MAG: alpha/beta hydrolase [Solirubrobacteraceae bacterium]